MKHGYILIELIVATLIASMVAGVLLTALAQSGKFQTMIDNMVDTSLRVGVVFNQLERDLIGAFVPVQAQRNEKQGQESEAEETMHAANNEVKKSDNKEQHAGKKDEKKQKPLEKIFYATNKDGNLDTLTFITNNPLIVYVGKDVGVVKPKIVRVQYTLQPEKEKTNQHESYILYRQESLELDVSQFGSPRSYEVIGGIKSLSMQFTARIEKKTESAKQAEKVEVEAKAKEKQKISYEYKTSKDWVSERKKEADKEGQEFPRIPYQVEIKIVLWDKQEKKEKEFSFVCEIPIISVEPKKPEQKKIAQPVKTDEQKYEESAKSSQKVATHGKDGAITMVSSVTIDQLTNTLENLTKIFRQM